MTGLRVPPGPASGARPDEGATPGRPAPPAGNPSSFGLVGWPRWGWRQLTSMRTALVLLFLLAVGSVPGSLLPQQGINPSAVQQYYVSHPALAPWLNRLALFNVFAAPWFAAIYLLLFVSLAGCVVPRSVRLARSARALPPPAPRNLARLPQSARHESTLDPAAALDAAAAMLRRRKFRLRTGRRLGVGGEGIPARTGQPAVPPGAAGPPGLGGPGRPVRLQGQPAAGQRDLVRRHRDRPRRVPPGPPGVAVGPPAVHDHAEPLQRQLRHLRPDRGQPPSFHAYVSYSAQPGAAVRRDNLQVNHPLVVDGVRVFIIGHGYAPVFRVTDGTGQVVFDQPVPFIAVDTAGLTSEGVIKVPDAQPDQLGLHRRVPAHRGGRRRAAGVGLPGRAQPAGQPGLLRGQPRPGLRRAAVGVPAGHRAACTGWRSARGRWRPGSRSSCRAATGRSPSPATGSGSAWPSPTIRGSCPALLCALAALAGLLLSFFVRRRRVFVRAPGPGRPDRGGDRRPGPLGPGWRLRRGVHRAGRELRRVRCRGNAGAGPTP